MATAKQWHGSLFSPFARLITGSLAATFLAVSLMGWPHKEMWVAWASLGISLVVGSIFADVCSTVAGQTPVGWEVLPVFRQRTGVVTYSAKWPQAARVLEK